MVIAGSAVITAPTRATAVVGIGASAGGLDALRTLLGTFPDDADLTYVVVVHLSPDHESHLADLLQTHTRMPVVQVTCTTELELNHVYVIPPNANLDSVDSHLRLTKLERHRSERAPIDHFFRTLSSTHDGKSIGIVLTGTGTDGALGIREIKARNGLTIVQDPDEAEFRDMPEAALRTGMVDQVLPLRDIAAAVLAFSRTDPRVRIRDEVEEEPDNSEQRRVLYSILSRVRVLTGRDFARYKKSTVLRRIQRRMQLHQIESLEAYAERLEDDHEEVKALGDDVLVTVTNFFRDPEVWAEVERRVIPSLFANRGPDDVIRVWTVGCATGEEAYSIGMLLLEESARRVGGPRIQVFASDLHEDSLERAREGFYAGDIATDVGAERVRRFFTAEAGGCRVRRELREVVVFSPHNLLTDPPFSRQDLVICRNLLIYLQRDTQAEVLDLFHYALRPDGWVLLGTSETADGTDLFVPENKRLALYRKRESAGREPRLPVFPLTRPSRLSRPTPAADPEGPMTAAQLHARLMERWGPPSVVVSPDNRLVHVSHGAGRFLTHPAGEVTASVYRLVPDELRMGMRDVLRRARLAEGVMRSGPARLEVNGAATEVELEAWAAHDGPQNGYAVVLFNERMAETEGAGSEGGESLRRARMSEAELALYEQRMQTVVREYETSQEEMRASHEELQSSNEELRSVLEELETSKEELQSVNEELQAVNQENRHKVEELAQLSSDLQNLLTATEIATIFLDRDLRILRFTPSVSELFNVRVIDRGRPLLDLTHRLRYPDLIDDAQKVLERLTPTEREVRGHGGDWYLVRILPYRSTSDRIEGVVITIVDVTQLKITQEALRLSEALYRALIEASAQIVWTTDAEGEVREVSPSWSAFTGQDPDESTQRGWLEMVHPDDRSIAEESWRRAVATGASENIQYRLHHAGTGEWRWTHVRMVPLRRRDGTIRGWVGMNIDISERVLGEEALREARDVAERASGAKSQFLSTMSHELRTPLTAVIGLTELLATDVAGPTNERQKDYLKRIKSSSWHLVTIIDEILTFTRSEAGKIEARLAPVDIAGIVSDVMLTMMGDAEARGLELTVEGDSESVMAVTDGGKVRQIVMNLVGNAIKYTEHGSVHVRLDDSREMIEVSVADTGPGIPEERHGDVFEAFVQLSDANTRSVGGTGLGLSICTRLAALLGGRIELASAPGSGSTFTLLLPRRSNGQPVPAAD